MRRSTRCSSSGASPYFGPFQSCRDATDAYAKSLNLRPLMLHLPFDQEVNNVDLHGLTVRLSRNKSFLRTSNNPCPPPYPFDTEPFLQKQDLTDGDAFVDALVASLSNGINNDPRRGFLLMFVQPPLNGESKLDKYKPGENDASKELSTVQKELAQMVEDFADSRPLAGVVFKIGCPHISVESHYSPGEMNSAIPRGGTLPPMSERLERCLVGAFCRRSVPDDVAQEILQVTLVRGIVEAICYEDMVLMQEAGSKHSDISTSDPIMLPPPPLNGYGINPLRHPLSENYVTERDKRFISINTHDLGLLPYVLLPILLYKLRFVKHWDRDDGAEEFVHEDNTRECSCIRKTRNILLSSRNKGGPKSYNTSMDPQQLLAEQDEFYQFFTLNTKRLKALIETQLPTLVPEKPSNSVLHFCHGTTPLNDHVDVQLEVSDTSAAPLKRHKVAEAG